MDSEGLLPMQRGVSICEGDDGVRLKHSKRWRSWIFEGGWTGLRSYIVLTKPEAFRYLVCLLVELYCRCLVVLLKPHKNQEQDTTNSPLAAYITTLMEFPLLACTAQSRFHGGAHDIACMYGMNSGASLAVAIKGLTGLLWRQWFVLRFVWTVSPWSRPGPPPTPGVLACDSWPTPHAMLHCI